MTPGPPPSSSPSPQEREFNDFGISKSMRKGFLISIMSLFVLAIAYLFKKYDEVRQDQINMYKNMYERIDNRVDSKLQLPVQKMNEAANKVDSTTAKMDSTLRNISQYSK